MTKRYTAINKWQKGRINGKNYDINLDTGIATFDLHNQDNVSSLMMMYLATHYFKKNDKEF